MAKHIKDCSIIQYADDTQIILSDTIDNVNELTKKAGEVLMDIRNYFLGRGLLLNTNKTQCMFAGSAQYISRIPDNTTINCNNETIKVSHHVINLGLHMDRFMSFSPHIDAISRKVSGILMYLNKIKDYFDDETRVLVVQSLVSSVINYCIKIWGTTSSMYIEKVQKLQNFAARVAVQGVRKYDHITPTLEKLKWIRIKERYSYEVCLFIFKILRKQYPSWLYCFPKVGNNRNASTRQNEDLFVRKYRTYLGSRSMTVKGPSCWNTLPQDVKKCVSVESFKNKLKNVFLNSDRESTLS